MKLNRLREKSSSEMHEMVKLEQEIQKKIQILKKFKKKNQCSHSLAFSRQMKSQKSIIYQSNVDYHDQFWKRFLTNQIWINMKAQLEDYLKDYNSSLQQIKKLFSKRDNLAVKIGVKKRKPNERISKIGQSDDDIIIDSYKDYNCKVQGCQKSYISKQALDLHFRIAHTEQRIFDTQNFFIKSTSQIPIEEQKIKIQQNLPIIEQQMVQINSDHIEVRNKNQDLLFHVKSHEPNLYYSNYLINQQNSSQEKLVIKKKTSGKQIKRSQRILHQELLKDKTPMPVKTRQNNSQSKKTICNQPSKQKKIKKKFEKKPSRSQELQKHYDQQSLGSLQDIIQLQSSNQLF